jgi:hypothetical protein
VVFAAHTSQAGARAYIGSLGPSRSKFDKESDYNHQLGSMFRDASKVSQVGQMKQVGFPGSQWSEPVFVGRTLSGIIYGKRNDVVNRNPNGIWLTPKANGSVSAKFGGVPFAWNSPDAPLMFTLGTGLRASLQHAFLPMS